MPGKKKTFPCGHQGKGQFCHRCAQQQAQLQKTTQQKNQWNETFQHDPVDLRHLPTPKLIKKARQILHHVQQTNDYTAHKGKRLNHDRAIISIPLGRDYRILLRDQNGTLTPLQVLTHEDYNKTKPGA